MNKSLIYIFIFCPIIIWGQQDISLQKAIEMAQKESLDSKIARFSYHNSFWQFSSFKKSLLPEFSLDATLPNLNRSINKITLPDGQASFVEQSQSLSRVGVTMNQPLPFSGGKLFVNTDLSRIDILGKNQNVSYLSTPVSIGISQSIGGFNSYKWQKKIQPLYFEEAQQQTAEDFEQIAIETTQRFFRVLSAQVVLKNAELNELNNDTIYRISKGRFEIGKIAESDFLQTELNNLNSQMSRKTANINLEMATSRFKLYLGIPITTSISIDASYDVPQFDINANRAIAEAKANRSEMISYERQIIEAEQNVKQVKSDNTFNADLFVSYGLTQSANNINSAYSSPQDQQVVSLGINVPLYNWGVSKSNVKQAKANQQMVAFQMEQAGNNFEQEVMLKTLQFNLLKNQVEIAKKVNEVSLKRYDITQKRYIIGKTDILDLGIALTAKDRAMNMYLNAVENYWLGYYEMRKLTHFDFEKGLKIEHNVEEP